MRFEFREGEGLASLLQHHGTDLDRFTPHAIAAIGESFAVACQLGRPYAKVSDLLIRLSLPDEIDEEHTRRIMTSHGLTTERIMDSVVDPTVDNTVSKSKLGIEPDFRELLLTLDYGALFYPGLPRTDGMPLTKLDLLHNALMWTKDSAAQIVADLRVNTEHVLRDCRVQRWYSDLYSRAPKDPTEPFPLKRRHRRLRSTTLQQEG